MEENQLKNSDQQKDTGNTLQNIEENKQKKNNMPIIISAIVVGFLFIAIIALILIFGQKAEEIKEIRVFNLGSFGYREINSEKFDKKIIKSKSELEDFYKSLQANYTLNKVYKVKIGETDYYEDSNIEHLPTYCDWAIEMGDEDGYNKNCLTPISETQSKEDFCLTEFTYGKVPDYCEDFLEDLEIQMPSGLDNRYFEDHDLIIINFVNGWCGGGFNRVRNISKNNKTVMMEIGYNGSCGPCAQEVSLILVEVDKGFITESDIIRIEETQENNPFCSPGMSYKPMIYLYPEVETKINVRLGDPESLTTTYPQYDERTGWQIIARPDGTLRELGSDREYYGLYWEGTNSLDQKEDGFIVSGNDTAKFLEEKLEILGLNERESNEFIIYWLPKMEHNKYNYIRFATSEEIEAEMPLEISPKPKTLIRVLMEYKPLNEKINIKEQKLEKVSRNGYTVVEWGGTELK